MFLDIKCWNSILATCLCCLVSHNELCISDMNVWNTFCIRVQRNTSIDTLSECFSVFYLPVARVVSQFAVSTHPCWWTVPRISSVWGAVINMVFVGWLMERCGRKRTRNGKLWFRRRKITFRNNHEMKNKSLSLQFSFTARNRPA